MKYTAKGLETEPYKAYSRDAFNDEEKGVSRITIQTFPPHLSTFPIHLLWIYGL